MGKRLPIVADWQCARTGDCCRQGGVRMHVDELAEIERVFSFEIAFAMPSYRTRANGGGFVTLSRVDGDAACPFLAGGGDCLVYEARPFKCRQFQCHRAPGEAFDPSGPLGCRNLSDRLEQSAETRTAYAKNQKKAQKWALTHGWTGREA